MHDNDINKSSVAGRDIIHNGCPLQSKNIDIEDMLNKFQQHWDNTQPATDQISKSAMGYFVDKTKELESLLEVYMNAIVDCFYCMKVEDRTRISLAIMEGRKKIRDANRSI